MIRILPLVLLSQIYLTVTIGFFVSIVYPLVLSHYFQQFQRRYTEDRSSLLNVRAVPLCLFPTFCLSDAHSWLQPHERHRSSVATAMLAEQVRVPRVPLRSLANFLC